jgi:nucleotide-binding universal stress UspA family protein
MAPSLERILIAVDEGPSSDAAVEQGLALAVDDDAEVVFVHVVSILGEQPVPGGGKPDRAPARTQRQVLGDASARAAELGVISSGELLVGYPPKQIAALAQDRDVDLLVVGSRNISGVRKFLLGSTSRALLSETDRPVLVVPQSAPQPALL